MNTLHSELLSRQRRVTFSITCRRRRGSVLVLITLLMIPLFAMVALAIDYGYLLKIKTDLQRFADAAALACVQDLVPAADGSQDLSLVRARLRDYVTANSAQSFQVLDADIEIGRYDPATIYSNVTLLNSGVYDTVRVTVRRDQSANSRVGLFFAPVLGVKDAAVTAIATAVLQKASGLPPGADVLPFAVPRSVWDTRAMGANWSIYGDGKIQDSSGGKIPGNWGTVDIGPESNSTNEINTQITNGLTQSDLDALNSGGRISTNTQIDAGQQISLQGETGLSTALKQSVQPINGQMRVVPIYQSVSGTGNTAEFVIVKWGIVKVIDSNWSGAKNTYLTIKKSYDYQGDLKANPDLGSTSGNVAGAYTSPVLVE